MTLWMLANDRNLYTILCFGADITVLNVLVERIKSFGGFIDL